MAAQYSDDDVRRTIQALVNVIKQASGGASPVDESQVRDRVQPPHC